MAISFNKRENEKKKQQKKAEKQKRKEERKTSGKSSFDEMIAYVDEHGVITSTPPEMQIKEEINQEEILISTPKKSDDDKEEDAIRKGRVEYFSKSKGYGFIKDLGNAEKYFFHINQTSGIISEGDEVTFDLERGVKGMNAVNVRIFEADA